MKILKSQIDLIAFDFDGVLTNNRVFVFENGKEAVICNRSDGLGFDKFREEKLDTVILTTETNSVVKVRAHKLKVDIISGLKDKKSALKNYCIQHKKALHKVIYIGNDWNDYEVMRCVGFPLSPNDACDYIKSISKNVMKNAGGEGIAWELAFEIIDFSN